MCRFRDDCKHGRIMAGLDPSPIVPAYGGKWVLPSQKIEDVQDE
jgi:hypothetical protein